MASHPYDNYGKMKKEKKGSQKKMKKPANKPGTKGNGY